MFSMQQVSSNKIGGSTSKPTTTLQAPPCASCWRLQEKSTLLRQSSPQIRTSPFEELSAYAKQFFTLFLRQKNSFQRPAARAYFRAYDASPNRMGSWPANSWELTLENLKLAVLDFRRVPGFVAKGTTSFDNPYFMTFMEMFMQGDFPHINEPPAWLWICGDKETELQLHQLAGHGMLTAKYVKKFSTYILGKFERLEDLPATHRNARAPITLLFLIRHIDVVVRKPK